MATAASDKHKDIRVIAFAGLAGLAKLGGGGTAGSGPQWQVGRVWRRPVSALVSDWEALETDNAPDDGSLFRLSWLSSADAFNSADLIVTDLALELSSVWEVRLKRDDEAAGVPFAKVIANFPDEPTGDFWAKVQAFRRQGVDQEIDGWRKFGEVVATTTVILTYGHRSDLRSNLSEQAAADARELEDRVQQLARRNRHWLIVDVDEVLKGHGDDCYVHRNALSAKGVDILVRELPGVLEREGVAITARRGQAVDQPTGYVPDRCEAWIFDDTYLRRIGDVEGSIALIGPVRLTRSLSRILGETRCRQFKSISDIPARSNFAAVVVLTYEQPASAPRWLESIGTRLGHPIVELPCLWRGREQLILSDDELALRSSLRTMAENMSDAEIDLPGLSEDQTRYVARCCNGTHRANWEAQRLEPLAPPAVSRKVTMGLMIKNKLLRTETLNLFGPYA